MNDEGDQQNWFLFTIMSRQLQIEVMHVIITFYNVVIINVCNFLSELI